MEAIQDQLKFKPGERVWFLIENLDTMQSGVISEGVRVWKKTDKDTGIESVFLQYEVEDHGFIDGRMMTNDKNKAIALLFERNGYPLEVISPDPTGTVPPPPPIPEVVTTRELDHSILDFHTDIVNMLPRNLFKGTSMGRITDL